MLVHLHRQIKQSNSLHLYIYCCYMYLCLDSAGILFLCSDVTCRCQSKNSHHFQVTGQWLNCPALMLNFSNRHASQNRWANYLSQTVVLPNIVTKETRAGDWICLKQATWTQCWAWGGIQDSRLLYYFIREIKTWLNINHITVHNNTYFIF